MFTKHLCHGAVIYWIGPSSGGMEHPFATLFVRSPQSLSNISYLPDVHCLAISSDGFAWADGFQMYAESERTLSTNNHKERTPNKHTNTRTLSISNLCAHKWMYIENWVHDGHVVMIQTLCTNAVNLWSACQCQPGVFERLRFVLNGDRVVSIK